MHLQRHDLFQEYSGRHEMLRLHYCYMHAEGASANLNTKFQHPLTVWEKKLSSDHKNTAEKILALLLTSDWHLTDFSLSTNTNAPSCYASPSDSNELCMHSVPLLARNHTLKHVCVVLICVLVADERQRCRSVQTRPRLTLGSSDLQFIYRRNLNLTLVKITCVFL